MFNILNLFNRYRPCISRSCKYSNQPRQVTFIGEVDKFNGVIVDSNKETCQQHVFAEKLHESLTKWNAEKKRCIWFRINIKDSYQVPILANKGFTFHHARDDFVMMYKWLSAEFVPNLPPPAHTNLGVGAMVFNDRDQILAISENYYEYPHWKLPGGYVERGEDIAEAAVREVKEETGVDAAFISLVTFRHTHNMMYGNSDIYVLLTMRALSEEIIPSSREIKDCKWMCISEYTSHPHVHEFNRFFVKKALQYKNKNLKLDLQKKTVTWPSAVREMSFLLVEDFK
ncbi:uncharacterized protein LOC131841121 [Achroia grisella]|uniref:uncharacterized protein LOC131841121 n=1 Tax=Achroia grisella TaxID=688607 RepID=UPI0027D29638|nr:uncharacterized protein LOC131841121 [Achroia grisella]